MSVANGLSIIIIKITIIRIINSEFFFKKQKTNSNDKKDNEKKKIVILDDNAFENYRYSGDCIITNINNNDSKVSEANVDTLSKNSSLDSERSELVF